MLIPQLYDRGERVSTYVVPGELAPRVTGATSYLAVNMWAAQRIPKEEALQHGLVRRSDSLVHESAVVDATALLVGPVLVGPESVIGPGAMIVGPTTVGAACCIEHRTVVSRSAIWNKCTIGSRAIVDHCILTDSTCVSPDIVARDTVFVPRHRFGRGIFDRLAAYCRLGRDRVRGDKSVYTRRLLTESGLELRLPDFVDGLPTAAVIAAPKERHSSTPIEVQPRC